MSEETTNPALILSEIIDEIDGLSCRLEFALQSAADSALSQYGDGFCDRVEELAAVLDDSAKTLRLASSRIKSTVDLVSLRVIRNLESRIRSQQQQNGEQ